MPRAYVNIASKEERNIRLIEGSLIENMFF